MATKVSKKKAITKAREAQTIAGAKRIGEGMLLKKGKMKKVKQTARGKKLDKAKKHALPPGKRVSKSGKIYHEHRSNRSD